MFCKRALKKYTRFPVFSALMLNAAPCSPCQQQKTDAWQGVAYGTLTPAAKGVG